MAGEREERDESRVRAEESIVMAVFCCCCRRRRE